MSKREIPVTVELRVCVLWVSVCESDGGMWWQVRHQINN